MVFCWFFFFLFPLLLMEVYQTRLSRRREAVQWKQSTHPGRTSHGQDAVFKWTTTFRIWAVFRKWNWFLFLCSAPAAASEVFRFLARDKTGQTCRKCWEGRNHLHKLEITNRKKQNTFELYKKTLIKWQKASHFLKLTLFRSRLWVVSNGVRYRTDVLKSVKLGGPLISVGLAWGWLPVKS